MNGRRFFSAFFVFLSLGVNAASGADIRVPGDVKTIQEAVTAAPAGAAVIVEPGEYKENITLKRPLTLKSSAGHDLTVITAAAKTEPVVRAEGVNGFTISGFTLRGSTSAGILVRNSSSGVIEFNRATGNENGILVYSSKGLVLSGNSAEKNGQYGIYLENSDGNKLSGNNASVNGDKGIFLSSSHSNELSGNSANLNMWNGIVLWASNKNILKDNNALRNTFGIVISESSDNEVSGNSTWPNLFIILPIILIYIGIVSYLIQRTVFRMIFRGRNV